ncbi:DNase I-like protein [Coprinellus micaceus]|uniref:DNase I-like protein n=1 Tax=Coprinellus micaceus TaxID=71717 RepID=A0A4Y7SHS8_COPMI|nr:DNase I-like protein [Coprinellus micaceus]
MRKRKLGVLAVQETHLKNGDLDALNERMKSKIFIINSGNPNRPNANGVAIILNRQTTAWAETQKWVLVPGRALMVQFPWKNGGEHRTILNVYAPNDARENETFWKELASKWDGRNPPPKPDIMLGDMNIVEDSIDRIPIHGDDPNAVEALRSLKCKLGLIDGWREEHPETIAYSYPQETTRSQSRIDRVYTTKKIAKTTREWIIEPSDVKTDHNLVSFHYYEPGQQLKGKGRPTLPLWIAKDEYFLKLGRKAVRQATQDARTYTQAGLTEDRPIQYPVQQIYNKLKIDLYCVAKGRVADAIPKMKQRIEARTKDLKRVKRQQPWKRKSARCTYDTIAPAKIRHI